MHVSWVSHFNSSRASQTVIRAISLKGPIRAVLLDVDGTLYHQSILRCLMALELAALPLQVRSFKMSCKIWRSIGYFRRVREELRCLGEAASCLAELQYREAAQRAGEEPSHIEEMAAEWIDRRPLKYLKLCRRRGIEAFFAFLQRRNIQVGVFSDHPVLDKLKALGLADKVSLTLSAIDSDINAFKPHPKGFLHACRAWGLPPEAILYVGDRLEVDAIGAAQAGMPCAILSRRRDRASPSLVCHVFYCASFADLQRALAKVC